jgi:hypothetical protein
MARLSAQLAAGTFLGFDRHMYWPSLSRLRSFAFAARTRVLCCAALRF